ncbi:MAG: hypothetical protein GY798_07450 [Hyphomicrobiales bacterium]|nr:hypothetical protein [Hyphomicrobiales bacterium]
MNRKQLVKSIEWIFVSLISLGLGIQWGLSFGKAGNHATYVVPGIHLSDPSVLASDWWTTQTYHPHITFTYLVSALVGMGVLAWGLAIINIALVAASAVITRIWTRLIVEQYDLLAWLLFMELYFSFTGSHSFGNSYLFSSALQPSNIASISFLLALFLICRGNYLATGLVLFFGGLFHVNFLILQIAIFALLTLAQGWRRSPSRLIKVIGPSIIALGLFLPDLLAISFDPQFEAAGDIFVMERFPHHYDPLSNLPDLAVFVAWLTMGITAATVFGSSDRIRRSTALALFLLSGFVCLTVLASALWPVSFVTRLFPWRLAPFVILLSLLMLAAALITGWTGPQAIRQRVWAPWRVLVLLSCLAILFFNSNKIEQRLILALFTAALSAGWAIQANAGAGKLRVSLSSPKVMAFATCSTALILVAGLTLNVDRGKYNLVVEVDDQDKYELYDWVRSTPEDSLFLIPPNFQDFRLLTRRAVVVDWKANPVAPGEVMEWRRRILIVSGIEPPLSFGSVMKGYQGMSGKRLRNIRSEFGISHAIFRTTDDFANIGATVVFRNDSFVVLDLTGT